ncbi:gliding motility-associated C-terminal domain-containing protein [Pontibacter sp. 172403-2]|uniref:gliding motility-associated C-terminal domain-containing protein n=1 Tax=Pontibacter rufus TaxID=2791028 RepID=UPI0018AFBE8E|nr:gliding motility-associated C-terminal domain-containing protein [Pontibacter sp. 172403-2]MBF9253927.1 gliding motility-associated C-terminal domain-containing protein [Pontibacter sp. 172403-2]
MPVIKPTAPFASDATEIFICKGGSAILDATIAEGYTYEWSNGNTISTSINVTGAGTYFVEVTDENGCVGISNKIKVIVNDKLISPVIQVSGPTAVCESGSVTLSVPYIEGTSYFWRKDGKTIIKGAVTSITVTEPGVYSLMESNSCGAAYSKKPVEFIIDHPIPAFAITSDKPLSFCEGDSITFSAPVVPHATYVWKKNGIPFGDGQPEQVIKEEGQYSVDLMNACGVYSSSNQVAVTVMPAPEAPAVTDGRGCTNSRITLTAKGVANGMYQWYTSEKGETAITGAVNETFVTPALSATTTYYVTASNGSCESARVPVAAIIETVPAAPIITVSGASTVCHGERVILKGPSLAGLMYQWKKNGKAISGATDSIFYAKQSGAYTLEVRNTCGSKASSNSVKVVIKEFVMPPVVQGSGSCEPASLTLKAAGGSSNGYRWYESSASDFPIPNATGGTFVTPKLKVSKTYYVSVVQDGCESEKVPVAALILPFPDADAGETLVIEEGQSVTLQGSGGTSYTWEPATDLSDPNIANPVASPRETTTYRLTVTNQAGCQDTAHVVVLVEKTLDIPNAFSPNGDGVNDTWQIGNILEFPGVKLEVFNRWGNKIYQNDSYQNDWNGTYRGNLVPVGAYFYIFTLPSKRQLTGYLNVVQ